MINCTTDVQCPPYNYCSLGSCAEESIFAVDLWKIIIYAAIPLCLSMANFAGISGGFLRVFLLINLLGYNEIHATYIAYIMNLACSLVNFVILVRKRNPQFNCPIVDYDLARAILPSLILGTMVGHLATHLTPILLSYLATILVFAAFAVVNTYQFLDLKQTPSQVSLQPLVASERESLEQISLQKPYYAVFDILLILLLFTGYQLVNLNSEGKVFGLTPCNQYYPYYLTSLVAVFVVAAMIEARILVRKRQNQNETSVSSNYGSYSETAKLSLTGLAAGLFNGLLAGGAGHMMNAGLNTIGVVASATSGFLIFFTSAAASLVVLLENQVSLTDFCFFFGLSFAGSALGTLVLNYRLDARLGRRVQQLILIGVSAVIIGSTVFAIFMNKRYFGLEYLQAVPGFDC